ncbi:hypothetical protein BKH42_03455 [Helicobacter sp. 13S00482-2]|uniref:hypothetical protein n=1 Tax=Helicobacter sp. 13S00482-2 TaxID=1476200 RepID=UPI000BA6AFD6|nr:hypothetical protein [Helicobacter sp. 13S00482-2]PAF53797.1 hypothetical protein BKH42_03455 [Helicobacter sp. 13S00482-2]
MYDNNKKSPHSQENNAFKQEFPKGFPKQQSHFQENNIPKQEIPKQEIPKNNLNQNWQNNNQKKP